MSYVINICKPFVPTTVTEVQQDIWPNLDPNYFTLMVFPERILKKITRSQKIIKTFQHAKSY